MVREGGSVAVPEPLQDQKDYVRSLQRPPSLCSECQTFRPLHARDCERVRHLRWADEYRPDVPLDMETWVSRGVGQVEKIRHASAFAHPDDDRGPDDRFDSSTWPEGRRGFGWLR